MSKVKSHVSDAIEQKGLGEARVDLREKQEKYANHYRAFLGKRSELTTDLALSALQWRRQYEPTDLPGVIRRGLWKFEQEIEDHRIDLAEQIIHRIEPGACEDPQYLALMAYQAASIEMSMKQLTGRDDGPWSKVFLGTIHSPDVNAFAKVYKAHDYAVVTIYSALVDFIYQSARAIFAASDTEHFANGLSDIRVNLNAESINERIQRDPKPAQMLYQTLAAYFFDGYPRAHFDENVKEENVPPLSMLIALAERFVIAHEYGHKFAKNTPVDSSRVSNPEWAEEFYADRNGMFMTVMSGSILDAITPEVSLSGPIFSLACADIISRAFHILVSGQDVPDQGSDDHPPATTRAQQIEIGFHETFEVQYDAGFRQCDLAIRDVPASIDEIDPGVCKHIHDGAFYYANALYTIWKHARTMLLQDYAKRRPLHKMWIAS